MCKLERDESKSAREQMTDKVGGKHAALWERMRAQKRPQMIHRRKPTTTVKGISTKEAPQIEESKAVIPMSITMSPEHSSQDDDSELLGIQISHDQQDQNTSQEANNDTIFAAKGNNTDDETKRQQNESRNHQNPLPPPPPFSALGTSFISASTNDDGIAASDESTVDALLKTPAAKSRTLALTPGLTPGILWKDWQQEQQGDHDDDDDSNVELLQQSMISAETTSQQQDNELTKMSVASLPSSSVLTASPSSPLTAMRQNSMHQALEETHVYIQRIQELEQALQKALIKNVKGQSTPSNFPQENQTPSPLLERNKTLIKEVRFAEQTCVELSERNAALEQEVERLDLNLAESRSENEALHHELVQSNRDCATLQAEKDALQVSLQSERESVLSLQEQVESLQHENAKLQSSAGKENDEPSNTITTPNKSSRRSFSGSSPTSQVLAKTLQTQLERGYSESDKVLELETKLAESNKALETTRQELQAALANTAGDTPTETSHCSGMSVELELARAQAKLAQVSKELQLVRIAESSARHDLSQARVEIDALQREKRQLGSASGKNGGSNGDETRTQNQVDELEATMERLAQECRQYEEAAAVASDKIQALEHELFLSRQAIVGERERLQEEFFEMTQTALGNAERQSANLDQQVKAKADQFASKLDSLSSAVQLLQDSLDFQSEASSTRSSVNDEEEEAIHGEAVQERDSSNKGNLDNYSTDAVLNATFHQSQSGTRSINEEMLLEQMEEARPVDTHADAVGHDVIEDLSFIADLSHLYEDLSGLLMHDPTSPARIGHQNAAGLTSTSPAVKSTTNMSSVEKSSIHSSLESVEQDFVQLKAILARAQRATALDNHVLLATIEEQSNVIHSLERKLGDLADEAGKSEAERRQLNVAVLEMSKAYNRCQTELKDTSEALKASQDAENEARSEIKQALEKLLGKLQEKERFIATLQNEKEKLSSKIQQLSDSSRELLRKRDEEGTAVNGELEAATKKVEKLQREVETKSMQLEDATRRYELLSEKVEGLENLRQTHERRIAQLRDSVASLETERVKIESNYNESESIVRALSREREHHKQEMLAIKSSEESLRRESALDAETISVQKQKLENVRVERNDAVIKSTTLSRTVEELTNARSELLLEVEKLKATISSMEGELDHLKVSYITCNDKLADASEKNASKDKIVKKFQSSNRAAKEAIASYEERISCLNSELETKESERTALQERLVAVEKELQATVNDFISYKEGMEEKLSERNDLIEVVQSTADALKATYEHKMAALTTEHEATKKEFNQAVSDFMAEFRSAYTDSLESLSQIGVTFDDDDFAPGAGTLAWNNNLKAASNHLPHWKQVVVECSQLIFDYQERLNQTEEKVETLVNTSHQFRDAEEKLGDKLREQQRQTQSLSAELRLAQSEAAKSAREVAEMSDAFVATKRELAHVSQLLANQTDLKERTEALIEERDEAESRLAEMTKALTLLERKLKEAVGES